LVTGVRKGMGCVVFYVTISILVIYITYHINAQAARFAFPHFWI
jgi:hypothetical protein